MAAYPSLAIEIEGSSDTVRDGIKVDVGADGYERTRKTFADKHTWILLHKKQNSTQVGLSDASYAANGTTIAMTWTSPWDGVSYNVKYRNAPQKKAEEGGLTSITVTLAQA